MSDLEKTDEDVYDLKSVKLPYLAGTGLSFLVKLMESPLRSLLTHKLFKDAGIKELRRLRIDEPPCYYPLHGHSSDPETTIPIKQEDWLTLVEKAVAGLPWPSVKDYAAAYRSRKVSPVEVAENVLQAIEESDRAEPQLRAVISAKSDDVFRQAEEAGERLKRGEPLSILDGVPIAVKDELDLAGYSTKVGTTFLGSSPATQDATIVSRLRKAGAVLVGKTNMHEIGIGVTGLNPHYGTARNPYNLLHHTGGSSSGSASAVASGIVPLAVGADGGGSIRIPSSFCGLVGLKSTFGRVSEHGAATLVWSVAHNGVLANNAADAALAYAAIAGPDVNDPLTLKQPAPALADLDRSDLTGLKLGIFRPWFNHAETEVVTACEQLVQRFAGKGAQIIEINIPELDACRTAHVVTIVSEMARALERFYKDHHKKYGLDVRLNLALARQLTSMDFLQAQRVRTRVIAHFTDALKKVDAIATPATGIVAPPIHEGAIRNGESDLTTTTEIMRFAAPANLTGLPAIAFPAGYTENGLPIGLQIIGRPWREDLLLRLAQVSDTMIKKQAPLTRFTVLPS